MELNKQLLSHESKRWDEASPNSYKKWDSCDVSALKGKIIAAIEGLTVGSDCAVFLLSDGKHARMAYYSDCCATCSIEDICGDVSDLIGSEVLQAECVESSEVPEWEIAERKERFEKEKAECEAAGREHYADWGPNPNNGWSDESETWAFYKLATIKGSVTIRWYGSSNGYYSETATFEMEK